MKKIKKLLSNWSLSANVDNNEDNSEKSEQNNDECSSGTHLSIEENKDSQILRVGIHPDAFFADSIELYDAPPLSPTQNQYNPFPLQLNEYCATISFDVTISPKLCALGYARVDARDFVTDIERFKDNLSLENDTKREYFYIPMIVELPTIQRRHGLFDDLWAPTLMIIARNPQLYRYQLTDAFVWRYQYVRIREYTSLKMDVIGEIPSALGFEIIGHPVRAVLPNYMQMTEANVINADLQQRKQMMNVKQWTVFENSFWIKIESRSLRKLPLMKQCIDKRNDDDRYFDGKGYIIQQYLGHTVLECIGPILCESDAPTHLEIVHIDSSTLELKSNEDLDVFDAFPSDLIAHIISFCGFEFVQSVVCSISKAFYHAAMMPSCYHTATIPSTLLHGILQSSSRRMLSALTKCKSVNVYSLVFEAEMEMEMISTQPVAAAECCIEQFHLEFVTEASLHIGLFNTIAFGQSLKVLTLTQCNVIDVAAFGGSLPDHLEELTLMNTLISGIDSCNNLKHLRTLIMTKSANLHFNNASLLRVIIETLPAQILECLCIWDDQEENKIVLKQLVEQHNRALKVFVIGGRICLYHPFSTLFASEDALWYPRLEIITVSCLSTNEIRELIASYGHQLRILEMYCPFVMEQEQDIYQWLVDAQNIQFVCASLSKLEILMCQAFPHHMKRYMTLNKWRQLKNKFEEEFKKYRTTAPLILFDLGIDLNKIRLWSQQDIKHYLIKHQKQLELNFGEGV